MHDYVSHSEMIRGYKVEIVADPDRTDLDPRKDDLNVGVMLCEHRSYDLGDSRDATAGYREALEHFCNGHGGVKAWTRWLKAFHGTTTVLPLYLYDHSSITISAGANLLQRVEGDPLNPRGRFLGDAAGWDTSTVGFIFDTAASREEPGTPPERVEEVLRAEVSYYAAWLEGDVWGYVITDASGQEVESCWGFIGDDYVLEEARGMVPDEPAEVVEANERAAILARLTADPDPAEIIASMAAEAPLPWLRTWATGREG